MRNRIEMVMTTTMMIKMIQTLRPFLSFAVMVMVLVKMAVVVMTTW